MPQLTYPLKALNEFALNKKTTIEIQLFEKYILKVRELYKTICFRYTIYRNPILIR